MKREIKFRSFADFGALKIMLEEVTVHVASGYVGLHYDALEEALESTGWKLEDEEFVNKSSGERIDFEKAKVYPGDEYFFIEDTNVMQFTGLQDKNGKDVYESDVIRIKQGECVGMSADGSEEEWIEIEGQVLFEDAMFFFEGHSAGTLPLSAYKDEIEVIGNIYSNHELLNP